MGEAQRADARGSTSITLNPSGVALSHELAFEGAFAYRPADSATLVALSGCDSTVAAPGCYYYRYFSASPEVAGTAASRRVHEGGIILARTIIPQLVMGVGIKYFDYESTYLDEGESSGFGLDAGATIRPLDFISVGVAGHNLLAASSPQYPRTMGAGITLRPMAPLAIAFDAAWNLDTGDVSTGRFGGGAEYFLQAASRDSGFPLRAGVIHDAGLDGTYITAGAGLQSFKIGLDLGARVQVSGGDELVLVASLRIFGPRQVAGTGRYR